MREKWNYVLYLMWFSYLVLSAVIMFGHGFLLSRRTLRDVSECVPLNKTDCNGRENGDFSASSPCSVDEKIRRILATPGAPIVCAPTQSRVVLLLVDALRYDFTEYDVDIEKPLAYQNRLPVMRRTLDRWPDRARLFRFMADPPTTTLQRVKALVTGSLPTFVDASSNFAAMELQEDNVIDQITRNGGSSVLLGDDTWARLLPRRWLRSHAMYSFHTWDLDTVDTEIDSKIYDELKKDDWNLLIAHYLGVDHAGHRYGPNHPEMTRKLNETNSRLERIIEMLHPDTVLYVIGDHGMTDTGDHGGESRAERTATIFAYRGSGFGADGPDAETGREVQQTDLTPTLSAALGRPPPSPSLGNLLLPILPKMGTAQTLLHLSNNLKQIKQYLVRYGEESRQISLEKLAHLINASRERLDKTVKVETDDDLANYIVDVRGLMDDIRGLFREVWVEFDSVSMLRALLLLILAIFFNWLITEGLPIDVLPNVFASSFVPTGISCVTMALCMCYFGYNLGLIEDLQHAGALSAGLTTGAVNCVLVILHWDGITQRWFDSRSKFHERFSRVALIASAVVLVSNSYIIEEAAVLSFLLLSVLGTMAWHICTVKSFALWVCTGAVMAVTRVYRGCREEQGECWTEGSSLPSGQASRLALVVALASTGAVLAVTRRHLGWGGHGLVGGGLLACAHWAVGWGSLGSPGRSRQLARWAWAALGAIFVLLWRREGRGATLPVTVLVLVLYVGNCLVLGAAYAPAAALALLSGFLVINMIAAQKSEGPKFSLANRCSSSAACVWVLLASYQFYGTGHHATLGHVRWAPAFHAGDPNYLTFGRPISGVLVFLELFGLPLMFGAAVPLVALWEAGGAGGGGAGGAGPRSQLAAVFSLSLKFALGFTIRVFVSALAATIHCRHLMIWGVFTPKLIFEGGTCAAALLGAALGAALAARHLPAAPAPPPPPPPAPARTS